MTQEEENEVYWWCSNESL